LAGGVALLTSDINENSKVTVTWGDTVGGVFDYISDLIGRGITAAFAAFGTTTTQVWTSIVNATRTAVNFIAGSVTGLVKTLGAVPKALARIFTTGDFRGAFEELAATSRKAFSDAFSRDFIGEAAAAISPFAQARAVKRMEDDAKKAGKSAGEKAGKSFVDSMTDYINKNTGRLVTSLQQQLGGAPTFPDAEATIQRRIDEQRRAAEAEREISIAIAEGYRSKFLDVARQAADIFGGSVGRAADRLATIIERDFPDMAEKLGRAMDGISEGLGTVLKELGKAAQFGSAVGSLGTAIFGGNSQGAQIGGAIGASIGSAVGGPLGMVVGSILGSALGGVIKGKNNFADAFITAAGGTIASQRGGQDSINAGLQLANAVAGQLNQLAQSLGGTLSATARLGNIGFSGEQFYFNASGQAGFGHAGARAFATAEEAVAAAIQNAVNIGAFEGVREGTLKILQAGGDLATNIQNAIAFEETFRSMEQALDPVGVALKDLESRFANMRNVLQMGGATTEELARLEQWYSQERIRLTNDQAAALDSLAQSSKAATAAARELAAAQQRIAQERYQLETRLLQLEGNTPELRARELAALDESNRALQEQIYALEDQRAAEQARAQAAQQAAAAAAEAQRRIEDARRQAMANLQSAINAERSAIQSRLNPLQNELARLVDAITPAAPDLVAALEVRDLLSEGLDLAARIAGAARGLMGDNEQIIAMQRDAARRELFRMAETRRIDAERIDDLIAQATRFGQATSREAGMLERARTANLLMQLAAIQEEQTRAAQAVEDERAANAERAVRDQIALLQSQISIEERSLARLDQIAERFLSIDNAVMSVADAVRAVGGRVPNFAAGGMHGGGLAIVGEQGPELVNMGPARVWNAGQTQAMMQGSANGEDTKAELVKQNEYLRELVKLNAKQERTLREIELQGEPA
jgi:hypothetical protein